MTTTSTGPRELGAAAWRRGAEPYATRDPHLLDVLPAGSTAQREALLAWYAGFNTAKAASEPRAVEEPVRALKRSQRAAERSVQFGREAAARAAAAANQRRREHPGTTMRRIERLEADLRRAERNRRCDLAPQLEDELTYWREHLKQLEASGAKVWSSADFRPGDLVHHTYGSGGWSRVVRVNRKSVTIAHPIKRFAETGGTVTVPYDKVLDRREAVPE